MSRRIYLLGVLVLGAFLLTQWFRAAQPEPPPGLHEANVARIRLGMTRQEVEAILGTPRQPPPNPITWAWSWTPGPEDRGASVWESPDGWTVVEFQNERVSEVGSPWQQAPGFLEQLRSWAGLQNTRR
jgi:hypothetical protein